MKLKVRDEGHAQNTSFGNSPRFFCFFNPKVVSSCYRFSSTFSIFLILQERKEKKEKKFFEIIKGFICIRITSFNFPERRENENPKIDCSFGPRNGLGVLSLLYGCANTNTDLHALSHVYAAADLYTAADRHTDTDPHALSGKKNTVADPYTAADCECPRC